jgi:ribose transport system permease protein
MTEVSSRGGRLAAWRKRLPAPLAAAGRWLRRTGTVAQILSLVILVAVFAIGTKGKYLSWTNIQTILSRRNSAILPMHLTVVLGGIDLSVQGVASLIAVFVGCSRNRYNSTMWGCGSFLFPWASGGWRE